MSDRIAVFNDGVIQQLAEPPDLYERPENAFVAQFIGENNKIFGRVTAMEGDTASVELAGNIRVDALAVNCGGVGQNTMLSIRPERVLIGDASAPNVMEGRVVELIYLGDHIRCRMEVAGTDDFIVKIANSHEHAALKVGERTPIGWVTEDCRALDAA
jgi:putative spermidine/putrescine transport system ATP-binding protein